MTSIESIFKEKKFISEDDLKEEIKNVIEIGYVDEKDEFKNFENIKDVLYCYTGEYIFFAEYDVLNKITKTLFDNIVKSDNDTTSLFSNTLKTKINVNNPKRFFKGSEHKRISVISKIDYKSKIPEEHKNKYCLFFRDKFFGAYDTKEEALKFREESHISLTIICPPCEES